MMPMLLLLMVMKNHKPEIPIWFESNHIIITVIIINPPCTITQLINIFLQLAST